MVYITKVLSILFEARPEMLKSHDKVTMEFIVEHLSTNDIIPAMADRKVTELSYKGMAELCGYIEREFKFPLFPDPKQLMKAIRLVDIRNVIVHNRGSVNAHLVQRQPEFAGQIGFSMVLTNADVRNAETFLTEAAEDIDLRAIAKFGIPTAPDSSPRPVPAITPPATA
jgi:hypothetical protein